MEEEKIKGILHVVECRDAKISFENGVETLQVNLSSDAPHANHVVPRFRGKEGITLVSELFGNKRDIRWGKKRLRRIERHREKGEEYSIKIANARHPARWTSGKGFVIIDGYALLNIRDSCAEMDPGKLTDLGGYGDEADLFDPAHCAHRETAEESAILTLDKTLLFPEFSEEQTRGVDFEAVITKACKDTGLEFKRTQAIKGYERKDLAEGHRIIIRKDGELKHDEKLQFGYDPTSNCGIDVSTTLEYKTGLDPRKELTVGFAEYYPIPGGFKVFGQENNMVFVDIYALLEEFDRGVKARTLEAHLRNAYTEVFGKTTIDSTNINFSLRQQLETMKKMNYRFGSRG